MDYDTFIGEVQNRAQLPSRESAVQVSRITLETFSERIEPNAAENLAAQLPDEIGRHLEKIEVVERFDWDDFVDRIVEKGGYNPEDERAEAVHHARVVIDVVNDAATEGAIDDIRDQLSEEDWDQLYVIADQEEQPVEEEQRPE